MLTKHVAFFSETTMLSAKDKRSARIIMTNEARVLRDMRLATGMSMRKAAGMLELSDSYIAQLETGRMDIPTGDKLQRILDIYGGIKIKSFYERARLYKEKITPRDELLELIHRAGSNHIDTLLTIAKSLMNTSSHSQ